MAKPSKYTKWVILDDCDAVNLDCLAVIEHNGTNHFVCVNSSNDLTIYKEGELGARVIDGRFIRFLQATS